MTNSIISHCKWNYDNDQVEMNLIERKESALTFEQIKNNVIRNINNYKNNIDILQKIPLIIDYKKN